MRINTKQKSLKQSDVIFNLGLSVSVTTLGHVLFNFDSAFDQGSLVACLSDNLIQDYAFESRHISMVSKD